MPALIECGTTVVCSPLVSLVEDQLWILKTLNIKAAALNSTTSKEDQKQTISDMINPNSDLKIIFVTPGKLFVTSYLVFIQNIYFKVYDRKIGQI